MSKPISYAQWSLEPYCIGTKLRALRRQKRMTLSLLAGETGLSTALLSKLETDRMIPTLPTLATISRVYGVGLSHFFSEPSRHTLSITRKAHLEGNDRGLEQLKVVPLNLSSSLNDAADRPRLTAQMIEFPAAGPSSALTTLQSASALIYVLEGQLELESGGMREKLEAGDCAFIDSEMALSWSASGKRRCRVLAVLPGEQRPEA